MACSLSPLFLLAHTAWHRVDPGNGVRDPGSAAHPHGPGEEASDHLPVSALCRVQGAQLLTNTS